MRLETISQINKQVMDFTKKDDKKVGIYIIDIFKNLGILGESASTFRVQKSKEINIEHLVRLQFTISALYSKLRRDSNLISDVKSMDILKNNYNSVRSECKNIESIWLYYRLTTSLGAVTDKFTHRIKQQEYQFLVSALLKTQAYLMVYIDLAKIDNKINPNITTDEYFVNEFNSIIFGKNVPAVNSNENISVKLNIPSDEDLAEAKRLAKEKAQQKKNKKKTDNKEPLNVTTLPPETFAKGMFDKLKKKLPK